MITTLQLDSYQYKCKDCHRLHMGPTWTMDFKCVREQMLDHGRERIYEADASFVCECTQNLKITFRVREYPEGIFGYHGYQSADAEIIIAPKVREQMEVLV